MCKGTEARKSVCVQGSGGWALDGRLRLQSQLRRGMGAGSLVRSLDFTQGQRVASGAFKHGGSKIGMGKCVNMC